jgi:hypothetical protein
MMTMEKSPQPSDASQTSAARINLDQFTQAAFSGVLRALAAHQAVDKDSPFRNPVLIYGIIALPEQLGRGAVIQQPDREEGLSEG